MNQHPFKFSAAARLYAKNIDLIDEIHSSKAKQARQLYMKYKNDIGEMRTEAYRNVVNFRDLLVCNLDSVTWQSKYIHKKDTHTVGKWAGGLIHWRWYDEDHKTKISRSIPDNAIYFAFPHSQKLGIINDAQWKGTFEILSSNRLKVWIFYDDSNPQILEKIMGLKEKPGIGSVDKQVESGNFTMWLSVDKDDPVGSATKRIETLLREIYLAQYPR